MLDNYQRAIIEKMQHSPRNLIQLAQLLKMIDERPGLAHYNYCGLLDIHEVTFYRNLKTLRTFGLVHPTKYKLNPKAELATATTTTIEDVIFYKWLKSLPSDTPIRQYAAAVANDDPKNDAENLSAIREFLASLDKDTLQNAVDLTVLFVIAHSWLTPFKDKEGTKLDKETLNETMKGLLS